MNRLIGFFANLAGAGKVWAFLDGKKTYAVAALGILTALAGLGTEAAPILAAHDTAGLLTFLQHVPADPMWKLLLFSLGGLGIGHKLDKLTAATAAAAPQEP